MGTSYYTRVEMDTGYYTLRCSNKRDMDVSSVGVYHPLTCLKTQRNSLLAIIITTCSWSVSVTLNSPSSSSRLLQCQVWLPKTAYYHCAEAASFLFEPQNWPKEKCKHWSVDTDFYSAERSDASHGLTPNKNHRFLNTLPHLAMVDHLTTAGGM